jgi:hypothetical protein
MDAVDREVAATELNAVVKEIKSMGERANLPPTIDGKAWNAYRERLRKLETHKAELMELVRQSSHSMRPK